ncbi:hypothetical protein IFM89_027794 [Coptis chinensis]|uniref:Uncharacterized protein n=1 Tax=Coptis chinensis TaxID=261450 RepID=A0A835IYU3_9MAGN|nr:hypothetical protein IFM89_027794 [Coptis chinensis]
MSDFNSFIHSNAVIDSTTMGFKYSRCNKRMGHRRMYQKINRMLVNQWVYGNTKQHLKALEDELENILKEQEHDPFNSELHNQEVEKATEIQAVKDVEILTLRQKARVTEALQGERNSKYFHATTKMRLAKSQIVEIQDD